MSALLPKEPLFLNVEKFDVIDFAERQGKTHTIHRVLEDNIIHHSSLEHGSHCNVRLQNRRTGVAAFHLIQDDFAVHRFDIIHTHETDDRLHISHITLTIVAKCIRSKVANQIGDPIVKPVVYGHIRVGSNNVMPQFILRICQSILCLGQRLEAFFFSAACFGIASCGVQSILSLANARSACFAFEIFPITDSFPKKGSPRVFQRGSRIIAHKRTVFNGKPLYNRVESDDDFAAYIKFKLLTLYQLFRANI